MVKEVTMQDINFFSQYEVKPQKTRYGLLAVVALVLVAVFLIAIIEFTTMGEVNTLKSQIEADNGYLNSPEVKARIEDVNKKTTELETLKAILLELQTMDVVVKIKGVLHVGLFDDINKCIPAPVYINNMAIGQDSIVFSGYADSYQSVAQLHHQLLKSPRFKTVNIPSITDNNGSFTFSLSAELNMGVK